MSPIYEWPSVDEFLDREKELAALDEWWSDGDRTPVSLYGRRRCGKSWLFRRLNGHHLLHHRFFGRLLFFLNK